MYKTSIIILATAIAIGSPAHAAMRVDNDGGISATVRYDDLDLSGPAGAKALQQRVHSAARVVCGAAPDIRELQRVAMHRACIAKAELSARPQVDRVIAQARTVLLASK